MTIAVTVGPTSNSATGTTPSVTLTGTTAGRSIIVGVIWYHNANDITISAAEVDAVTATVHSPNVRSADFVGNYQIFSLGNSPGSGNKIAACTLSSAPDFGWIIVAVEVSGANTSSFFDDADGGTGNTDGGGVYTVDLTAANPSSMIFALGENQGGNFAPGAGYTYFDLPNLSFFPGLQYNADVGAAGAKTVEYDAPSALAPYAAVAAVFNAAAAGGTLSKVNNLASASISKCQGTAKASLLSYNGLTF